MSMRSASLIGGSAGGGSGGRRRRRRPAAPGSCGAARRRRRLSPASARNGSIGRPGISASTAAAPAAIASGFGLPPSWRDQRGVGRALRPPLVTTMPAAVETSSAGIWETSPSPTVSVV